MGSWPSVTIDREVRRAALNGAALLFVLWIGVLERARLTPVRISAANQFCEKLITRTSELNVGDHNPAELRG